MIRDIFIFRLITNCLLISSVIIVDESVPWVSFPKVVKMKKNKNFIEAENNQEMEEV